MTIKYMGSKRWMLRNGLGKMLDVAVPASRRFFDLFAGSAAVASHVATRYAVSVVASDLQRYSQVLADAVLMRTKPLDGNRFISVWIRDAQARIARENDIPLPKADLRKYVLACREWCARRDETLITKAYGGYYFSPLQALMLDALMESLPHEDPQRTVARAAIIEAAAYCAAAPGHTAQPFQPTPSGIKFILEAWGRDVTGRAARACTQLCDQHARVKGMSFVADALDTAKRLRHGDLAFLDPPYSAVQYSRFYHVLETIAKGECGEVSGAGRYPDRQLRPVSSFSAKAKAAEACDKLLLTIAMRGANAIVTFPEHDCSNGLSGAELEESAKEYFRVKSRIVVSRFSSLGGTSAGVGAKDRGDSRSRIAGRAARAHAAELLIQLVPR